MEGNDTSVRILDLLFDLTSAERGRSRSQIRRLAHYRALSDDAFDSAFSRDKNTLKRVGVEITVRRRGDEAIYRIAAQSQQSVDFSADEIALIDLANFRCHSDCSDETPRAYGLPFPRGHPASSFGL